METENNHIIATFTLKASGKGKEAEGNKLHVPDCVRLYLLRHIPYSRETSSYSIAPLKTVQEYDSVKGLPDLKQQGYSYIRNPLREGYVYAYIEKKSGQGIYREYEVSEEGDLINLVWSDAEAPNVSWQNPQREQVRSYIPLKKAADKKIWITFSPIRWSKEYAQSILTDESKRNKRMQVVDCAKCFEGTYAEEDSFSVDEAGKSWQHSLYMGDYTESNYASRQDAFAARQNERRKQAQAQVEKGKNPGDFYISVLDPLGVADILCTDSAYKYKELQTLIEKMRTGDFKDAYNKSELAALIDLGTLVYRMWDTKTSIFYKYSSHLNEDLLKAVLQVSQRKVIRRKINKIRCALYTIVCDNAYQLVIEDYLAKDTRVQLLGKSYLCNHIDGVLTEPKTVDGFMDGPLSKMDTQSPDGPDIDKFIDKVITGTENTGKLLQTEWNLDDIAKTSALAVSAGDAFDTVVSNLGNWIKKIKDAKRQEELVVKLFKFTTGKGTHSVKFPECEIPDYMKRRIDYSHLLTSTIEGRGRAYTIDFSRVTDVNKQPLSARPASWKQLDELHVTVDTALSRWEKSILNAGDAKWKKGIEKFTNSPQFARGMTGLSIICLTIAMQKEKKTGKDVVDIFAYSTQIVYLGMKYVEQTKILENTISKRIITLNIRILGVITGSLFALSAFVDAASLFKTEQTGAASLLILSGLSGLGSTLRPLAGFTGGVIIALVVVSFVSAVLAEWISRTELQLLLENCAYGKDLKIKANSGVQLLQLSIEKSKKVASIRQQYLFRQQWALNQLITFGQGIMSARLRLYYEYKKPRAGGNQVVFESSSLDYITVIFHLLNMPLIQGKADIDIIHINQQGIRMNLRYYLEDYEDNVEVNAEKGLVVARFNIKKEYKANYKKYFTGGNIKVMVRTTHTSIDGKSVHTPKNMYGEEKCASFYFSYKNTFDFTQVRQQVGLVIQHANTDPPIEGNRLFDERKSIKAELEKWEE